MLAGYLYFGLRRLRAESQGQNIYGQNCSAMHGLYGPGWRSDSSGWRVNAMGLGSIPYLGNYPASIYFHGTDCRLSKYGARRPLNSLYFYLLINH